MRTLTSPTEGSPVKVLRVFADFRHGVPDAGTVFVGDERHKVQVYRTAHGLIAKCDCPTEGPTHSEAIWAFQVMTEAWERAPGRRAGLDIGADTRPDSRSDADQRRWGGRPYTGLARAMCEADLQPWPIPAWAYDEHGLRRPLCEAEVAADVWYEIDRALDRLLGEGSAEPAEPHHRLDGQRVGSDGRPNVRQYYRASWEPALGLPQAAYETDLPIDLAKQDTVPESHP